MTKEELIKKELARYALKPEHVYHGTNAVPAAFHKAMDEYAKQHAIAFHNYLLKYAAYGDASPEFLYDLFIEQQNKDNGNNGEG